MKTIAIIGGGAAGLAAAIAAGEYLQKMGAEAEVVLYEASDRVGRSILATGNGRCNFTNAAVSLGDVCYHKGIETLYHNGKFVAESYFRQLLLLNILRERGVKTPTLFKTKNSELSPAQEFFVNHGLAWREEAEGRRYPATNKASSVLDVLRASAELAGVKTCCGASVSEVARTEDGLFHIHFEDGAVTHANAVIVACGGTAPKRLLQNVIPHTTWEKPVLVLGPIEVSEKHLVRELDNIRVRVEVSLVRKGKTVATEKGEVLFRKYGVSGIAVFNLSRMAKPGDTISINFSPGFKLCDLEPWLYSRRKTLVSLYHQVTLEDFFRGLELPQVANVLVKLMGRKPTDHFMKEDVPALAEVLHAFDLTVEGIGDERQCQVHRGGFVVSGFDSMTLESTEAPGLHVVGEALDVDGPCGGYNLHWAWSSGISAGLAAACSVTGEPIC